MKMIARFFALACLMSAIAVFGCQKSEETGGGGGTESGGENSGAGEGSGDEGAGSENAKVDENAEMMVVTFKVPEMV